MVMNDGEVSTGQFVMTFSIDGIIAYQEEADPLDPGQYENTTVCWIPSGNQDYYVKFKLDPNNSIVESNETNNVVEITFKIPRAHKSQIDPQPFLFTALVVLSAFIIFRKPKRKTRIRIIRLRRAP
jgi:subtilase family serine protease